MYEYGTLKSVKVILRMGREKSENNGQDEANQGAFYIYMDMAQ
jgi:hypothetical protein